jgi:hypothetical protein
LKVPNTQWAGERLGSWYVRVAKEKSTSAAIQNRFAMAIPVHLTIDHALTVKAKPHPQSTETPSNQPR